MNRRRFLTALAASGAGLRLTGRPGRLTMPRRLSRIGIELWTVRDAMTADPEGTLTALRTIGYDDVELLWTRDNFGRSPRQVRSTLDGLGLRAPSAHVAPELLLKDWDRSLGMAHALGQRFIVVPSLPDEETMPLDGWKTWADHFNVAGAAARQAGLRLLFHNEPGHQRVIGGQVAYDTFVDRTDPSAVGLQLDVGNMTIGGGDPFAYLKKYGDRYVSFHLKDVTADHSTDAELGTGVFDFARFLAMVNDLDDKPCYVEQENPPDALAWARHDYACLRDLDF
jgi:sugar phosphate isomerase/epimerase